MDIGSSSSLTIDMGSVGDLKVVHVGENSQEKRIKKKWNKFYQHKEMGLDHMKNKQQYNKCWHKDKRCQYDQG